MEKRIAFEKSIIKINQRNTLKTKHFLFYLGHPAHYHMFKHTMNALKKKGHTIEILIKTKDILEHLLKSEGVEYLNILPEGRKDSKFGILIGLLKRDLRLGIHVLRKKPDLLIGSEPSLAQVGIFLNIPSLIFVEDDAHIIPHFAKLTFPFATNIVAPISCDLGKWNRKKIAYHGYQKLPYLHPNQFKPQFEKVEFLKKDNSRYFIIRVSKLNAHHDFGIGGLNLEMLNKIIEKLSLHGQVYISSERNLEPELKKYELKINASDIHHALFFSDMLIGDSQSMAVEAALLGTPSIRFSDFAGKIGVLEELENKYDLTFGISTKEPDALLKKIDALLSLQDMKKNWWTKREKLLNDKIDTGAFFEWLIENYPSSISKIKKEPEYQFTFR